MIGNRKKKVALIHVAKKEVGLEEAAYRALLSEAAGIESAAELEREEQFCAVMEAFRKLGFTSPGVAMTKSRPVRTDGWGGTPAQRAKIAAMWRAYAGRKDERALRTFIKRIAKVDHPRFLNTLLAQKVIIALERIKKRTKKADGAPEARRET